MSRLRLASGAGIVGTRKIKQVNKRINMDGEDKEDKKWEDKKKEISRKGADGVERGCDMQSHGGPWERGKSRKKAGET